MPVLVGETNPTEIRSGTALYSSTKDQPALVVSYQSHRSDLWLTLPFVGAGC